MTEDFTPVRLPLMGEGVQEATVVKWFRKQGEQIQKDEPLIEVSTDKVDTEIPSPVSGYLNHLGISEGETAQVDQIIGWIAKVPDTPLPEHLATKASDSPEPGQKPGSQEQARAGRRARSGATQAMPLPSLASGRSQAPTPGTYAGFARSSPLVRKMAKAHGVDLHQVRGTGLYGRITRQDFEEYLSEGQTRFPVPTADSTRDQHPPVDSPLFSLKTTSQNGSEYLDGVPVKREKMSRIRLKTAEHMIRSVRTSPHVTTTFEMNLHKLRETKDRLADDFLAKHGSRLTYTAFFLAAVSQTLKNYPELNSSIDGDDILFKNDINLGCAVAIDSGLIVPVIRDAGRKNLEEIALALNDLVTRAREKKLSPQDVQGGTFSVTNPGMYGSLHSQPIINQPQVGILSVGAIIERPVVFNKEIVIHPTCQIGLTFDHRIVDGEGGAKFLRDLQVLIESGAIS